MKLLVVGAGPAGLSCALTTLSNNPSLEVVVYEEKKEVGLNPRCAGGVSKFMLEKTGLKNLPPKTVQAEIRRVKLHTRNYTRVFEFAKPAGYVLDRTAFERFLASVVEKKGGRIVTGYRVRRAEVLESIGKYSYVVGADGYPSTVRRALNLPDPPGTDVHVCVQRTVEYPDTDNETVELFFDARYAPGGYAWVFPAGRGVLRIGLGVPLSYHLNPARLLDKFMERKGFTGRVLAYIAKSIPTARANPFTGHPRVILAGDAGFFCDPLTGGGIVPALLSGAVAGRAVAFNNPELYTGGVKWLLSLNARRYALKRVYTGLSDAEFDAIVSSRVVINPYQPLELGFLKLLLGNPKTFLQLVVKCVTSLRGMQTMY